jgi:hypothetical protein
VTVTVADDFDAFVAARWRELEPVALLATLDPIAARAATVAALMRLRRSWADVVDSGAPSARARIEVLRQVGDPGHRSRRLPAWRRTTAAGVGPAPEHSTKTAGAPPAGAGRPTGPTSPGPSGSDPSGGDHPVAHPADAVQDAIRNALLDALQTLTLTTRSALAAELLWDLSADDAAAALRMPPGELAADLADARRRLRAAHRSGRASAGLPPADRGLDSDLGELADALTDTLPDPPEPAALAAPHTRLLRRRALVFGGGATLTVAATWAWSMRTPDAGSASRSATTTGPRAVGWSSANTWPGRGPLAGDASIRAVAARDWPGARVLWAGDIGTRRAAVAAIDEPGAVGTRIRMWAGPRGAPSAALEEVPLRFDVVEPVGDIVVVRVPQDGGAALLALGRPTLAQGSFSAVVTPTPDGWIERSWNTVRLDNGVGVHLASRGLGPATRVRFGGYDGPPATSLSPFPSYPGTPGGPERLRASARATVSGATGIPAQQLRSDIVVDSPTPGSVIDASALSAAGGDGRVVIVHTRTPAGAVLRSVRVWDDGRASGPPLDLAQAELIPAGVATEPVVYGPLPGDSEPTRRFLVVATGAARVQLLAAAPSTDPVSEVVATTGDAAVVSVIGGDAATEYRLVAWSSTGRRIFDGPTTRGRWLADPFGKEACAPDPGATAGERPGPAPSRCLPGTVVGRTLG